MKALGCHHMSFQQVQEGIQDAQTDSTASATVDSATGTFQSVALGRAVQRLVLAELLERDHGQQARTGPASCDGMEWRWRLADLLAVAAGKLLNFSRTVSITFHWRGTTSSVRVTSSPSLRRRLRPQHSQAAGGLITTCSLGRCSGKVWRSPHLRVNPQTVVVLATARSAINSFNYAGPFHIGGKVMW
ncbi:hypothetical protein ACVWY2_008702 [Bradyrhizobium sp. JR6.1]